MKKLLALMGVVVLTACTVDSTGLRPDQLRKPQHLRTERILPMTFPEIQMALFKHEQTCGTGPVFAMNEGQTSYATVTEPDSADQPWNQTLLFDLTWYQGTWRYDTRTRVQVYSFYSDSDIKQRIAAVFNAILKPGECTADMDTSESSD